MGNMLSQHADGRDRVLLLDVGMEGVVEQPQARVGDRFRQAHGLLGAVEEVGLEAVERLDGEVDPQRVGILGRRAQGLDGPAPFLLCRPAPHEPPAR